MPIQDATRQSEPCAPTTSEPDTRLGQLLASAEDLERGLWLLLVVAMLVDISLTVHGLQLGLVEANPIASRALSVFGIPGLYGLKGVALGLGGCCRLLVGDRYGSVVPLGLAIPSLAAVGVNSALIASVVV